MYLLNLIFCNAHFYKSPLIQLLTVDIDGTGIDFSFLDDMSMTIPITQIYGNISQKEI